MKSIMKLALACAAVTAVLYIAGGGLDTPKPQHSNNACVWTPANGTLDEQHLVCGELSKYAA
jgi:hypothetical protein